MAYSLYDQYNLINDWQIHVLEDVWPFNQLLGTGSRVRAEHVYVQPDRDMIARSISEAFDDMKTYLHFFPVPTYHTERVHFGKNGYISQQVHQLDYGKLIAIGSRATTLIEAGATVTYSDVGGLGVDDTATITVSDSTTPLDEIRVFFQVTDGADEAASQYYEITPVSVTRSGSTVTITGHAARFVKPNGLWLQPYDEPNYKDRNDGLTTESSNYVTTVDVYRVYTDSTSAVTLYGNNYLYNGTADGTSNSCSGYVRVVDTELSQIEIQPASDCCILPEFADITYLSGVPRVRRQIENRVGRALFRLANTYMPRQSEATREPEWFVWAGDDNRFPQGQIPPELQGNPFGLLVGQLAAWRYVKHHAIGRGGSMTKSRRSYWG